MALSPLTEDSKLLIFYFTDIELYFRGISFLYISLKFNTLLCLLFLRWNLKNPEKEDKDFHPWNRMVNPQRNNQKSNKKLRNHLRNRHTIHLQLQNSTTSNQLWRTRIIANHLSISIQQQLNPNNPLDPNNLHQKVRSCPSFPSTIVFGLVGLNQLP